jgi:hypothetical protein
MSATVTPQGDLDTLIGANPDVNRVIENVLAVVPAVTPTNTRLCLFNALEEFALRGVYFRETVNWTMAIGVTSVDFNPFSADMSVCWILQQTGLYRWIINPPAEMVDLNPPTMVRTGEAIVALKPRALDVNFPPHLWTQWFETILDGTLGRLYAQPAKPWSNPQLAQYHGSRFRMGFNRARDIAARGYSNQHHTWAFPVVARGRRKQ